MRNVCSPAPLSYPCSRFLHSLPVQPGVVDNSILYWIFDDFIFPDPREYFFFLMTCILLGCATPRYNNQECRVLLVAGVGVDVASFSNNNAAVKYLSHIFIFHCVLSTSGLPSAPPPPLPAMAKHGGAHFTASPGQCDPLVRLPISCTSRPPWRSIEGTRRTTVSSRSLAISRGASFEKCSVTLCSNPPSRCGRSKLFLPLLYILRFYGAVTAAVVVLIVLRMP